MAIQRNAHNKPIIASTPESVGTGQVNFQDKAFNDVIFDKGYAAEIERAMRCPCASTTAGQGESGCLNCFGSGWFFIERTKTVLLCTSISNKSKYEQWSETNMGMVNISCRPQDKLGFMDKVILTELESWFTQVVKLNKSDADETKYFAFLIYEPIFVFDVYLYKDTENPLIPLKIDVDFTIEDNKLVINADILTSYLTDVQYPKLSLRYTHRPTYHIIDINRDLIKQKVIKSCIDTESVNFANFPLNCIGRRAHYILDNPNFDGNGLYDNTDYTKKNDYNR